MRIDGIEEIDLDGPRARQLASKCVNMDAETQAAYIHHELLNERADAHTAAWEKRTGKKYISPCERSYIRSLRFQDSQMLD